jgi:selenocysteine lyase/cysteine desulfurase
MFLSELSVGAAVLAGSGSLIGKRASAFAGPQRPAWDAAAVRSEFGFKPGLVYMNNGTLGPAPKRVIAASTKAWQELELNPAGNGFGITLHNAEAVRKKAAVYLGCEEDEIVIMPNTTQSMNTVAQGCHLEPGDRVLTTDQEHPGGFRCWEYYRDRSGVVIDRVPLPTPPKNEAEIVELLAAQLTPRTKIISVSHVTFTTGLRLPIARIAELADANKCLLVVDGAQAPGALNINVKDLSCDTYATSAHKWMLAPKGTGLLYINKRAVGRIDPLLLQDGNRFYTATSGTLNMPAVIGLGESIDFLTELGKQRIEDWSMYLRQMLYDGLRGLPEARLVSPAHGPMTSPIVTVGFEGLSGGDVAAALAKQDIVVKVVNYGNRISTHLYNDEQDVEKLVAAIKKLRA